MARPRLEVLEGRFAPATLQDFGGTAAELAQTMMSLLAETQTDFQSVAVASPAPSLTQPLTAVDEVFASARPLDPLMGRIGRLPEQSLEFPTAGGGGGVVPIDELLLVPATAPAASAEQIDEMFAEPETVTPEE